ncbi:MAG: RIP metalloprotease RseP [Rickettsiales bacterium]|nr:RIP metalloprotease RseP [Rickettsiales bacterium]
MDLFFNILQSVLSFIAIISIIVFIHEFGHYWVAKKCGVMIESFSIGFGKEIFGWNDKSGTRWKLSLIPLGGYVKMYGDENAASVPDKDKISQMAEDERKKSFHTQDLWKRFLIVLAGPLANYIFAIIILSFFFFAYGKPNTSNVISGIQKESVAEKFGLQEGDKIIYLGGSKIKTFEDIRSMVSMHPAIELDISYERNGEVKNSKITPEKKVSKDIFGNEVEVGLLGISSSKMEYKKLNFLTSISSAAYETYDLSVRTLQAVGQIITGKRSAEQISGILRIADYSGKSVEQGFKVVFWFMAVLSVNLGLVNLFPIPMLDGGHLFFYIIEGLRGKPLPEKLQEYFFRFGYGVLIGLMLLATFNDLKFFKIF